MISPKRFLCLLATLFAVASLCIPAGAFQGAAPANYPFILNLPQLDVRRFGAKGDGVTDDRLKVQAAIDMAIARGGGTVLFPKGTWVLSKYVYVNAATNLLFRGEAGAVIKFASDDVTVVDDATTDSTAQARSAFFVRGSNTVAWENLGFLGNNGVDITVNLGAAVYCTTTTNPTVVRCKLTYGSSIFKQDDLTGDTGARVSQCYSYGQRGNLFTGDNAVISDCEFELPLTSDYLRVGDNGSTHLAYLYAGRQNVTFANNIFRNAPETGIKGSGSSLPIRNIVIKGNQFINCGAGVVFGADDYQPEHGPIIVQGNTFTNCGTMAFNNTRAIDLYGCKSAIIDGNNFYYTHNTRAASSAGHYGIYAARYFGSSYHIVTGASMTSGSPTLTAASGFVTGDANKMVTVRGAGANGGPLVAMVRTYNNAGSVVLSENASTTVATTAAHVGAGSALSELRIVNNTFNAIPGRTLVDIATTSGSAIITSGTANFTQADVGTSVNVTGAMVASTAYLISVTNTTTATMSANATATVNPATGTVGGILTPGGVLNTAIHVARVGEGLDDPGGVSISHNTIARCAGVGVTALYNVGLRILQNSFIDISVAIATTANRMPRIESNHVIASTNTSTGAQIRMTRDAFPMVRDNTGQGRFWGSPGRGVGVSASAGTTSVDHPLLGWSGKVEHANAFPEALIAYGEPVENDQIVVDGSTFTYTTVNETGNNFNTVAGLISDLNALAGFDCADYGATWSVTTDHLRLRRATQSATANLSTVTVNTLNPTSLVILRNGAGANFFRTYTRGEGTTPGNTAIIWSPAANLSSAITVEPLNAAARTLFLTNGPAIPATRGAEEDGTTWPVEVGTAAATPSTETYRWSIR